MAPTWRPERSRGGHICNRTPGLFERWRNGQAQGFESAATAVERADGQLALPWAE